MSVTESYERLAQRVSEGAKKRADVRGVCIIGSRARTDHPADEWADLDMLVITTNPGYYLSDASWIDGLGKSLLTFVESKPGQDTSERRVLFEGMLDVDFNILHQEKAAEILKVAEKQEGLTLLLDVFGRGMRILIDKDQTLAKIKTLASSAGRPTPPKPSEQEFLQVVDDFLYHTVWTAKHLRRGELWWTLTCLDSYLQELIKTMIEWYTHTTDNWKRDTWFRGRFLEEWAEPEVTQELSKAFAHYDEEDAKRALMASMTLFSRIARETAQRLGYNYPASAEKEMANWIEACLSDKERRS